MERAGVHSFTLAAPYSAQVKNGPPPANKTICSEASIFAISFAHASLPTIVCPIRSGICANAAARVSQRGVFFPDASARANPTAIIIAIAHVEDCVGHPLREAWISRRSEAHCISVEPGVLERANVWAPLSRAVIRHSTIRMVSPLADSATTNVCSSTVRP